MRYPRLLTPLLMAALIAPAASLAEASATAPAGVRGTTAAATPSVPTLVRVSAGHRQGWDRVVFRFRGGLPGTRVRYVDRLIADGSGLPVRIAGQAVLRVRFEPAQAHTDAGVPTAAPRRRAFALPNVMTAVRAGDFEAVTTYGLGLAKRSRFRVRTLEEPSRVVVEVRAAFRTVDHQVFFFDRDRFLDATEPYFVPVTRMVRPATPATGVMDRLFAGPTTREQEDGLRLLRSGATGYTDLAVEDRVASVRLVGGCSSGGSTVTIAGEILPTLRQFDSVDWVKLYDPAGTTLDPDGPGDSTPECLEP